MRLTDEELAALDARAAEHAVNRSELIRSMITESPPAAALEEADLVALLEVQARRGHVRAIELLLRRVKPAESERPPSPLSAIVDEFAARRAG